MVVDKMGMRFSMILGGSSGALSTLCYWAVARQFLPISHAVAILSILAIIICLSCGLIIGSIFKLTLYCGGPEFKGSAVGVAKGFVGLGSGVYATIFQAIRKADESALDFVPVLAFFFVVCAVIPAYVLLPSQLKVNDIEFHTTKLHFRTLYVSLFILASVIVASSIQDIMGADDGNPSTGMHSKQYRDYKKVFMLLLIWLGPIWSLLWLPKKVVVDEEEQVAIVKDEEHAGKASSNTRKDEKLALLTTSYQKTVPEPAPSADAEDIPCTDLNLQEALQTPSAWLMLWTTIILVGSGTYKTNNMGEMVESLGFPDALNPATLAIFSVAQAAARIVTGIVSEAALKSHVVGVPGLENGIARPFFLVIGSAIAFFSHLMLAYATSQVSFVVSCTLSGLAFGMAWPLMVLIVGDIFGLRNHGAVYMFYDGSTKAFGTILLSEYIAGNVYEAHVDIKVDALTCYGPSCFRETHLTVAGLALTGIAASLGLVYTSRHAYDKHGLHSA